MTEVLTPLLVVDRIYGMMPTQGYGKILGFPFYFRARHGDWVLRVSKPGQDPVGVEARNAVYFAEGEEDSNGCMETVDVLKILSHHCAVMVMQERKLHEVKALA